MRCPTCDAERLKEAEVCPRCGGAALDQEIATSATLIADTMLEAGEVPATLFAPKVAESGGLSPTLAATAAAASVHVTPIPPTQAHALAERKLSIETVPLPAAASAVGNDPLVGSTIAGRFHIEALLGAGGMGTVYTAEQTAVGRKVVLKFLLASLSAEEHLVERFSREALAVSQLSSPNTIVLHDFGTAEDGRLYMAMEYLDGHTLADLIASAGALPPLRAIAITLQVLTSLIEAHDKGIVHRDLKPENIMLVNRAGTSDFVKVLDFGIAKILGDDDPKLAPVEAARPRDARITDSKLTQQGAIFGSPRYMSPEQVLGRAIGPRTDVYALGVILYELLAGRPPFSSSSTLRLLHDHAHTSIKPLGEAFPELGLPAELSALVTECLQKRAEDRPESARALSEALRSTTRAVVAQQEAEEKALLELVGIRRRAPLAIWVGLAGALLVAVALVLAFALRPAAGVVEGQPLAAGDRLFVSAAGPAPDWVRRFEQKRDGVARVVGLASRAEALMLAEALAAAKLLDVPLRFDAEREAKSFRDDLRRISEDYRAAKERLIVAGRYWVKLVEAEQGGARSMRYDGYAKLEPPSSAVQRATLRRALADRRFKNGSFLLDRAVVRRRCTAAFVLGVRVRAAIADLAVSKERKASMRGYLETQQLGRCKQPHKMR